MKIILSKSLWLLCFSLLLCCGLYPLALWTIGQVAFPFQANGSILMNPANQPVASGLIAQSFTRPEFFHPRPSAAGYNAGASVSSSLASSNPLLRQRIVKSLEQLAREGINPKEAPVPSDAVMTSGSGLDPHISLDYANRQLDRVVSTWAKSLRQNPEKIRNEIVGFIQQNTSTPLWGLAGEPIVNVMTLNWTLSSHYAETPHG